jgi:hypothetical protein
MAVLIAEDLRASEVPLETARPALLLAARTPVKKAGPQLRTVVFNCTGAPETRVVPAGVTMSPTTDAAALVPESRSVRGPGVFAA